MLGEDANVLGDPLVGVVGLPGEAQPIEDAVGKPVGEVFIRHPTPPAKLERLVQERARQHDREEEHDQQEEDAEGAVEAGRIELLKGGKEGAVSGVDQDVDVHRTEGEADVCTQERPRRPTLLAYPVISY